MLCAEHSATVRRDRVHVADPTFRSLRSGELAAAGRAMCPPSLLRAGRAGAGHDRGRRRIGERATLNMRSQRSAPASAVVEPGSWRRSNITRPLASGSAHENAPTRHRRMEADQPDRCLYGWSPGATTRYTSMREDPDQVQDEQRGRTRIGTPPRSYPSTTAEPTSGSQTADTPPPPRSSASCSRVGGSPAPAEIDILQDSAASRFRLMLSRRVGRRTLVRCVRRHVLL